MLGYRKDGTRNARYGKRKMANTLTHSLMGAAAMAAPSLFWDSPQSLTIALQSVGAIEGAIPDAVDWIGYQLGAWERWAVYEKIHHWRPHFLIQILLYPLFLHVYTDIPFHTPSEDWEKDTKKVVTDICLFLIFCTICYMEIYR